MFNTDHPLNFDERVELARRLNALEQRAVMRGTASPVVADAFDQIEARNSWAAETRTPSKSQYIDRGLGLSEQEVADWRRNLSDPQVLRESRQRLAEALSPNARAQIFGTASDSVLRTFGILGDKEHLGNFRLLEAMIGNSIIGSVLQIVGALPIAGLANALAWVGKGMTALSVGEVAINVAYGKGLSEQDQLTLLMTIGPAFFHTVAAAAINNHIAPKSAAGFNVELGPGVTSNGNSKSISGVLNESNSGVGHSQAKDGPKGIFEADIELLGTLTQRAEANVREGHYELRTRNGVTQVSTVVSHPRKNLKIRVGWDSNGTVRYTEAIHSDRASPPIESMNADRYAFGDKESRVVSSRTSPAAANSADRAGILEGVDYNLETAPRVLGGAGKIGVQRPGAVNDGGPDSIVYNQYLDRIEVRDVKGRGPGGTFPKAPTRNEVMGKWGDEISLAINGVSGDPHSGFRTKFPKLDAKVRKAWAEGRWDYVQSNVRLPSQIKAGLVSF